MRETAEMGSTNGRQHGLPMASNKCSMGTKNVPPTAIDFTGLDFTHMHANHNASSTNKAAQFSVSPPLKAMHANECVYYIQLTNSNGSWMLKPGFLTQTFEMIARVQCTSNGTEVPSFMTTFHEVPGKGKNGKYKRNKRDHTVNIIGFVVTVPTRGGHEPITYVKAAISSVVTLLKRADIGIGYADYMERNEQGLFGHFSGHKKGGPVKKTKEQVGKELVGTLNKSFANYTCVYEVPLSTHLCDYEVKQFLINYVGCSSFEDCSEIKNVYPTYPKKQLPDWDAIEKEDF